MDPKDEGRRAIRLLEALMQMSGMTREELDQRLGTGRSYSSQLFTHRMSLKYERVIQILQALDVEPGLFFRVLFPDPSEAGSAHAPLLDRLLGRSGKLPAKEEAAPPSAAATAPEISDAELDRRIQQKVEAALAALVAKKET